MPELLFLISFGIYFFRAMFFVIGSKRGRVIFKEIQLSKYPFVSIIIPARNEEKNILNCINSILESNYPTEKFEIIVVNDRSNDKTQELVESYRSSINNLRLLNIVSDDEKKSLGKPGALDFGIERANGEYILMTDADCRVNKKWITSIVKTFIDRHSDIVASFTLVNHKTFFDKYQANEWILMHTMASGGIGFNFPLGCFGNNMAIRKSVYNEVGGYSKIEFTVTEDLALLQQVHKFGGKIHYICHKESTVRTEPIRNLNEYLKQRKRWAVGGKKLGWKATLFVLASLLIWVSAVVSLISQEYFLGIAILLLKILSDSLLIIPSILTVKEKGLLSYVLPSTFIFLIIELILPFLLINGKVEWKGQVFE